MELVYSMADLRIFRLTPASDQQGWQPFVLNSRQANPFSAPVWLRAISEACCCEVDILVVARGEEWLGGIHVFWNNRFGKMAGLFPPQTPYGTVIYSPSLSTAVYPSKITSNHLEISRVLAEALKHRYSSVTHKHLPSIEDIRAWQWSGWNIIPNYTYIVDLTSSCRPSSSFKKHYAKCEKSECQLSFSWDLKLFWSTVESMLRRQATKIGFSKETFFVLAETLHTSGMAWMATALNKEGLPLASRIELSLDGTETVFDWVAGSSSDHLSSGVNSWLLMKLRDECQRRGYKHWNLCGANVESVAAFKSGIGGQLTHAFTVSSPRSIPESIYQSLRSSAAQVKWKVVSEMKMRRKNVSSDR
jgi:hypothetical protein